MLPSTALSGTVSRIVPTFKWGTAVIVSRYFANIIVTEYGYVGLLGGAFSAEDLIGIAHPDFRAELRREARKLLWP